jgi:hypothetical protein
MSDQRFRLFIVIKFYLLILINNIPHEPLKASALLLLDLTDRLVTSTGSIFNTKCKQVQTTPTKLKQTEITVTIYTFDTERLG